MYTAFAFLQIGVAIACLYIVTQSSVRQVWATLTFGLTAVVFFGNSLRVAWDMFANDSAFYLHSVVFPYASNAMIALLMVTAATIAYRAVNGGKF